MNTTMEKIENLKPLKDRLPLTNLHNMFGVCFDKKDTYKIYEVPLNDIKNPLTITNVLKSVGIEFTNSKETIICCCYQDLDHFKSYGTEVRPLYMYFDVQFCNTTMNKTFGSFGGDYIYRKNDLLPTLRKAIEVVVIEADYNSLVQSFNKNCYDYDRKLSCSFNEDYKMYNRIKFVNNYHYQCNEGNYVTTKLTDNEILERGTWYKVNVHIVGTNKQFNLSKTIGTLQENKWSDIIDKSGYNKNAFRVHQYFKLQDFKADKVRKLFKSGNTDSLQHDIKDLLFTLKNEVSQALLTYSYPTEDIMDKAIELLKAYQRLQYQFNDILKHMSQIGTKEEYTPYTMSIVSDLEDIKNKLLTKISEAQEFGKGE